MSVFGTFYLSNNSLIVSLSVLKPLFWIVSSHCVKIIIFQVPNRHNVYFSKGNVYFKRIRWLKSCFVVVAGIDGWRRSGALARCRTSWTRWCAGAVCSSATSRVSLPRGVNPCPPSPATPSRRRPLYRGTRTYSLHSNQNRPHAACWWKLSVFSFYELRKKRNMSKCWYSFISNKAKHTFRYKYKTK